MLKEQLSPKRFEHSLGVAEVSLELASRYGCEARKARLAGLLHDYARGLGDQQLLDLARENDLIRHPLERKVPVLLHGPVGALLVKRELGIKDPEILAAISNHTTGSPGMSLMSAIVYLADVIEPARSFPGVERLRELSQQNLHRAVVSAIDCSIRYCLDKGILVHPASIEARNEILEKIKYQNYFKEGCF